MTDTVPPPPETKDAEDLNAALDKAHGKGEGFFHYLMVYVLAILVSLATCVFWQTVMQPNAGGGNPAAVAEVSAKLAALEGRVAKLEAQGLSVQREAPVESGAVAPTATQEGDVEKLKTSLSDLSTALGTLQTQMEKSAATTTEVQAKAESGPATVIAYVRLERAARFGQPFEKERQAMRRMAAADPELVEMLMKMEPLALKGAASLETLKADWRSLEPAVQSALRKAGAKTWQDRILVALQDLVSIRSLDDKAHRPLSLEAIEIDLAHGDLAGVLQKTTSFPPEVQQIIKDWRAQVEARQQLDAALDDVAARLIAHGEKADETAPAAETPATTAAPASAMPDIATPSLEMDQRKAP